MLFSLSRARSSDLLQPQFTSMADAYARYAKPDSKRFSRLFSQSFVDHTLYRRISIELSEMKGSVHYLVPVVTSGHGMLKLHRTRQNYTEVQKEPQRVPMRHTCPRKETDRKPFPSRFPSDMATTLPVALSNTSSSFGTSIGD